MLCRSYRDIEAILLFISVWCRCRTFDHGTAAVSGCFLPSNSTSYHKTLLACKKATITQEPLLLVTITMSLYSSQVIRRSPWTCLSCSTVAKTSQALVNGSTSRSPVYLHQRKHSSSKTPSQPKDDSRAISAPTEAPTEAPSEEASPTAKETVEKRPSSRFGRRKSKHGPQDATKQPAHELSLNLPSVPSTAHLHPSGTPFSSSTLPPYG